MIKRIFCLILAAMLIFSFAACEDKSDDADSSETDSDKDTEENGAGNESTDPGNGEGETPETPETPGENGDGENGGGLDRNEDGSVDLPGVIW